MITNESIELFEENLNSTRINTICSHISTQNANIWCISLRKCTLSDMNFEKLIRALKKCKSLRYVNLNINIINSFERLSYLTTLLSGLSYLDTLCLHSSNLKDDGLKLLYYSLMNLEHFRSLDIGDCQLTDDSVYYIKEIIHQKENENGLTELILSSNSNITSAGWAKILIAVASSSDLKYLHLDYNHLDDGCGYLIVAILCSNHSLQVFDLEQTGIGNQTSLLLLYLLKNYNLDIKTLNLLDNPIDKDILKEIGKYVKNEFDLSTPEHEAGEKSKDVGLKIRDQLKLNTIFEKAKKFTKSKNFQNKIDFQRDLERDLNLNSTSNSNPKKGEEQNDQDEYEFLNTYEDQRYKIHNVLPFNLSK